MGGIIMKIWKKCITGLLCLNLCCGFSAGAITTLAEWRANPSAYNNENFRFVSGSYPGEPIPIIEWHQIYCLLRPDGTIGRGEDIEWLQAYERQVGTSLPNMEAFNTEVIDGVDLGLVTTCKIDYAKWISVAAAPQQTMVLQGFSMPNIMVEGGIHDVMLIRVSCPENTPEGTYSITVKNDVTGVEASFADLPSGSFYSSCCAVLAGREGSVNRSVPTDTYTVTISASVPLPGITTCVETAKKDGLTMSEKKEMYPEYFEGEQWDGVDQKIHYGNKPEGLENFQVYHQYHGYFSDVPQDAWYAQGVKACFERLVDVQWEPDNFQPDQPLTYQEMITYMLKCKQMYQVEGTPTQQTNLWNSLKYANLVDDVEQAKQRKDELATRLEFVQGMYRAFPQDLWTEQVPGVVLTDTEDEMAQKLCRAGVLSAGAFRPDDPITRAEAACIVARMIDPQQRIGA